MTQEWTRALAGVREILARTGIEGEVTAAGRDGDIAAVRCDPSRREELAGLASEIRSLGFRYVAVELGGGNHEIEDS